MAYFVARVELHGATKSDYDRLHELMKARSFARWIAGPDGVKRALPIGSYFSDAHASRPAAVSDVKAASTAVGKSYEFIVTEGPSTWENLPPHQ
jgi:hypothetical protein